MLLLNSGSSPAKMWVPDSDESVQASSDQHAVLVTKVEALDTFVNGKNSLVSGRSGLWRPVHLDLLGLSFITGLPDLSQLLLSVC